MIFLLLSYFWGKEMPSSIFFSKNLILFLSRKMKDDLSQKIHGTMIFSSDVLKK